MKVQRPDVREQALDRRLCLNMNKHISIYIYIYTCTCLSIWLMFLVSSFLFVGLLVCLFVCLFACLVVCLFGFQCFVVFLFAVLKQDFRIFELMSFRHS